MLFACICLYHCWCSLSTVRCVVEKALPTTNETVLAAHINLSVGSACHDALCPTNDFKSHICQQFVDCALNFVDIFVDAKSHVDIKDINDDGKRY